MILCNSFCLVDTDCPGVCAHNAEKTSPSPDPEIAHPVSALRWGGGEKQRFRKDTALWLRKPSRVDFTTDGLVKVVVERKKEKVVFVLLELHFMEIWPLRRQIHLVIKSHHSFGGTPLYAGY